LNWAAMTAEPWAESRAARKGDWTAARLDVTTAVWWVSRMAASKDGRRVAEWDASRAASSEWQTVVAMDTHLVVEKVWQRAEHWVPSWVGSWDVLTVVCLDVCLVASWVDN
jgi:hypothetical protein